MNKSISQLKSQITRPRWSVLLALLICSAAAVSYAPFVGPVDVSPQDIFSGHSHAAGSTIFWQMRLPRVFLGFWAGGTFAIAGMVFQAMFNNPLVAPETLGVSAGASLGATLYIWLGLSFQLLGIPGVCFFAFAGALFSIFLIWSLSKWKGSFSISKMLLAGVVVSFLFMSMIMFIQYLSDITQSFRITRWLMGGLFVYGYEPLLNVLPFALIGLVTVFMLSHELNLLTIGEETATSRGVDVRSVNKILFFLVSVIIGGVVAVCGPISFIGIIAPHIARLLIGSDHRYLTPAVFMCGGLLLTVCDAIARVLIAPAEIPVGIITAILGGPFFLWLLQKRFVQ